MKTALVALGGNAILKAGEKDEFGVQLANTRKASAVLAELAQRNYHLVVTHGNGPQIGDILLQNELSSRHVPPLPLDACGAESQGLIGYMLIQSMDNEFRRRRMDMQALCVLTRTIVSRSDPAFSSPSKPVGGYYTEEESRRLEKSRSWNMVLDAARGGYRRIVPSPQPIGIVEAEMLASFFHRRGNRREMLIMSGGGGIPVVREGGGYRGVEAVIDKDLAASIVASSLHLQHLFMLTDIDAAYLDFGTEGQRPVRRAGVREMKRHIMEGHFGKGSMLPKVQAAVDFVRKGGKSAIITSMEGIFDAIDGRDGTTVVRYD